MAKRLTAAAVDKLRANRAKRREIPDAQAPGLHLIIQPSGKKSWAVRYRFGGSPRKLTLGGYPAISLKDAREQAAAARDAVDRGVDPIEEQRRAKSAAGADLDLFENVAAEFLKRNTRAAPAWKAEMGRLLEREVFPQWRGKRIGEIAKRDVIRLLDRLLDRGVGVMANRVFAVIRRIFNWAVERDIIAASPCAGLKAPIEETARDRVLSDDELRTVWKAADGFGYPFGPIIQLLILTGQRRSEVGQATWSEIDLKERLWRIPGSRTKNGVPHDVALSDQAIAVLESLPRIAGKAGYLFTTTGETPASGFSRAKDRLDEKLPEGTADWRLHDIRRTVASGMARLGIALPAIEKVLNHTSGSFAGIVAVYQRHEFADEKRRALEAWGRFVETLVEGKAANVVELREALA